MLRDFRAKRKSTNKSVINGAGNAGKHTEHEATHNASPRKKALLETHSFHFSFKYMPTSLNSLRKVFFSGWRVP